MARQRQGQLVAGDAAPVVAHPQQPQSALLDLDLDLPGAGVDGVLDQFLDRRGGPLDDLAGGDLVDELRRQGADGHEREWLRELGFMAGLGMSPQPAHASGGDG